MTGQFKLTHAPSKERALSTALFCKKDGSLAITHNDDFCNLTIPQECGLDSLQHNA